VFAITWKNVDIYLQCEFFSRVKVKGEKGLGYTMTIYAIIIFKL